VTTQQGAQRVSGAYVVRHIVHVDRPSGALSLDIAPELLSSGLRFRLHAFSRSSALAEVGTTSGISLSASEVLD
jgi:hypothetical protein